MKPPTRISYEDAMNYLFNDEAGGTFKKVYMTRQERHKWLINFLREGVYEADSNA